jgi:protein-S-isoprenylcysteine O-methyltransferase Ste14
VRRSRSRAVRDRLRAAIASLRSAVRETVRMWRNLPSGPHHQAMSAWRHVRAILICPGVVTVAVPLLVVWWTEGVEVGWGLAGLLAVVPVLIGATLIGLGLGLVVWTVRLFVTVGHGTLAPWDPTSTLVVRGPYRHVRHPMITGVVLVLAGEAAVLGSLPLLLWCAIVFVVNAVYLPLVEEPGLRKRFGDEYDVYRAHVPRWVPRLRPWSP